jgi:hypothetical protein
MSLMINTSPYIAFSLASSGTVTDATVTSDWERNWGAKGCLIVVNRTVETGTATLACKLQGGIEDSVGTKTAFDVANVDLVSFADGETGLRYTFVYPGITGAEADAVVPLDTNFNMVNGFLPHYWRISVTHGGTSVANTFSVHLFPYP